MNHKKQTHIEHLPIIPLRDSVVLPHVRTPLLMGRDVSLAAIEDAIQNEKSVLLVAQKNQRVNYPKLKDLYQIGVVADILQSTLLPDKTLNVWVLAFAIVRIDEIEYNAKGDVLYGKATRLSTTTVRKNKETKAMQRYLVQLFNEYVHALDRGSDDVPMDVLDDDNHPEYLTNFIASYVEFPVPVKQELLQALDIGERMKMLSRKLQEEVDILGVQNKIMGEVKQQMDQAQKEHFLHEQMKAISKELGEKNQIGVGDELADLKAQLKKAQLPKEAKEYVQRELVKLEKMVPYSPEASVIRNYVEFVSSLPWHKKSQHSLDISKAYKVLEEDHYGLKEPKDRILEYLSVCHLRHDVKGSILCFVGPPGVGKTSLAQSIARAMGREYVRISLGGVRDEAEIRGHRRTYIGAMPGKIIQALSKAKVKNPLILLDEVDKMSMEFRGDPAAALLEVLDTQQNQSFEDHYLEIGFDLSDVMFIATANVEEAIPYPLHDRMEMIRLDGYTELEKQQIVQKFLWPKQLALHGLDPQRVKTKHVTVPKIILADKTIGLIIRHYTREAGVRQLERLIAKVLRKMARALVDDKKDTKTKEIRVVPDDLALYLGAPPFRDDLLAAQPRLGVVTGLAWTEVGGDIMNVEATKMKGKEKLILTGQMGDVMQESAQAALSYLRTHAKEFGIDPDFYENYDLHVHVPEGAIPKDGPSAGITIVCALYSVLTGKLVPSDVAMTGEVTLTGQVLRIGGLKAKTLAAHRTGIKKVILPVDNTKDLSDIPDVVKKDIQFVFVKDMKDVLRECFV